MSKRKDLSLFFCVAAAIFATLGIADPAYSQEEKAKPPVPAQEEKAEKPKPPAFGYDIFKPLPEPIVEGPVDEEFLLSPGDEVVVTVWGQLNLKYQLTVSEDGYLEIPDEGGRIHTSGVSFRELRRLVRENLSRIYSSYINLENPAQSTAFVDVKLGKIRKLLVYVMGEVKNQGAYTISSGVATLLNLLTDAGGVKETGSLREIKVRRAGGEVERVDLYEFLLTGKMDGRKTRIRYGDYVIVPLKGKSVEITGEVKRSGLYEVVGTEGIRDLVRFAGGLGPNAYLRRVQVRRFEANTGEKFLDLDAEGILSGAGADFPLMDGDEVTIFPNVVVRRKFVEVLGEGVRRPGKYEFSAGMTVHDLVKAAEGLKEDAYLERADLVRTEDDFSKRLTRFSLGDLYREESPGKFVEAGAPEKNFPLRELDQVITYSKFLMRGEDKYVTLEGHVKEPGKYVLPANMTLHDLVFARGGFQDEEFRKRAYPDMAHIFRKSPGEVEERILTFNLGKLLAGEEGANLKLEPSDRVVIYSYEAMEVKPFVSIEGLVKRPGIYDLAENMTLEDLIMVAGGLRPDAYKVEAVIGRQDPGAANSVEGEKEAVRGRVATIIKPLEQNFALVPDAQKTRLRIFDKIVIRNLPEWEPLPVVGVEGEVRFPGSYSLESREERISNLVARAGGIKKEGFAEGAVLWRRKDILTMARNRGEGDEPGKVAIDLRKALEGPGGAFDLVLKDGDLIYVPSNPGTVEVKGAVRSPGLFQFREGKGCEYYVGLSGGYLKEADKGALAVFLPNGAAAKKSGGDVLAGSVIDVPYKEGERGLEFVEVRGMVVKPAIVQVRKGAKLAFYIELCGGYSVEADIDATVVYTPDGRRLERKGDRAFNPEVPAGSIIDVPARKRAEKAGEEKK